MTVFYIYYTNNSYASILAGWWFDPQLLQPAIFTPNASISVCVCVRER